MSEVQKAIAAIEEVGYYRLRGLYDQDDVQAALAQVRDWYERSQDSCSASVPFLNVDQPTVYNLQNKDFFFLELLFKPKPLREILMRFLNDQWFKQIPQDQPNYLLRSYIARSSNLPMPLHLDSFIPYLSPFPFVMQYSIVLEDQDEENGATVVVPGSHLSGEYATQDALADAVPIESKAGDLVIWDSRLWHGTTANTSGATRWAIIATYCRWWLKQHWNVVQNLPQENYERLSDEQKAVLGFCSIPHHDESMGIDLKTGYADLSPDVHAYQERPQGRSEVSIGESG